jgi:Short C-terminal domain
VFLIFLPWLGALVYLIARGRSMNERALARAQRSEQAFSQYVRETAGASTSTADELAKLAELRDRGTISDEEFRHAKAKLLGRQPEVVSPAYTGGRPAPSTG